MTPYVFLAVLVALLVGLGVGKAWERYKLRDGRWIDRRRLRETPHYMLGLNFLVDDQVDQAIDELTQATSSAGDALEIQMILGNLLRRRDRSAARSHIHQALLQRPDLTPIEHAYVLLCLGLDFRHGGFVDRALEAFQEVRAARPAQPLRAASTCRSCTRSSSSGPRRRACASASSIWRRRRRHRRAATSSAFLRNEIGRALQRRRSGGAAAAFRARSTPTPRPRPPTSISATSSTGRAT